MLQALKLVFVFFSEHSNCEQMITLGARPETCTTTSSNFEAHENTVARTGGMQQLPCVLKPGTSIMEPLVVEIDLSELSPSWVVHKVLDECVQDFDSTLKMVSSLVC